jgi:toxoflavin synthase
MCPWASTTLSWRTGYLTTPHSPDDLQGMWANIAVSLKSGGRFLGIRVHMAQSTSGLAADPSKYGCSFTELRDIPGGIGCTATLLTTPPFSFGATLMEDSYTLANEIPKKLGMTDFAVVPYADADIVKEDPAFWQDYVDSPAFLVLAAKKRVRRPLPTR